MRLIRLAAVASAALVSIACTTAAPAGAVANEVRPQRASNNASNARWVPPPGGEPRCSDDDARLQRASSEPIPAQAAPPKKGDPQWMHDVCLRSLPGEPVLTPEETRKAVWPIAAAAAAAVDALDMEALACLVHPREGLRIEHELRVTRSEVSQLLSDARPRIQSVCDGSRRTAQRYFVDELLRRGDRVPSPSYRAQRLKFSDGCDEGGAIFTTRYPGLPHARFIPTHEDVELGRPNHLVLMFDRSGDRWYIVALFVQEYAYCL
jgi:hypothetical protein